MLENSAKLFVRTLHHSDHGVYWLIRCVVQNWHCEDDVSCLLSGRYQGTCKDRAGWRTLCCAASGACDEMSRTRRSYDSGQGVCLALGCCCSSINGCISTNILYQDLRNQHPARYKSDCYYIFIIVSCIRELSLLLIAGGVECTIFVPVLATVAIFELKARGSVIWWLECRTWIASSQIYLLSMSVLCSHCSHTCVCQRVVEFSITGQRVVMLCS